MACLTEIIGSQKFNCGTPPNAPLGKIVSARIINAGAILSYTVAGNFATLTRQPSSETRALETASNSLVVNIAMKGGEVYPQQHDVSIEATLFSQPTANDSTGKAITGGMNGRYVIAVDHGNGIYKVYGLGAPLEVLSVEGSSTGNGFVRTTFGVEDWQAGTTIYHLTKANYEALSTPAPEEGDPVTP